MKKFHKFETMWVGLGQSRKNWEIAMTPMKYICRSSTIIPTIELFIRTKTQKTFTINLQEHPFIFNLQWQLSILGLGVCNRFHLHYTEAPECYQGEWVKKVFVYTWFNYFHAQQWLLRGGMPRWDDALMEGRQQTTGSTIQKQFILKLNEELFSLYTV